MLQGLLYWPERERKKPAFKFIHPHSFWTIGENTQYSFSTIGENTQYSFSTIVRICTIFVLNNMHENVQYPFSTIEMRIHNSHSQQRTRAEEATLGVKVGSRQPAVFERKSALVCWPFTPSLKPEEIGACFEIPWKSIGSWSSHSRIRQESRRLCVYSGGSAACRTVLAALILCCLQLSTNLAVLSSVQHSETRLPEAGPCETKRASSSSQNTRVKGGKEGASISRRRRWAHGSDLGSGSAFPKRRARNAGRGSRNKALSRSLRRNGAQIPP